MDQPIQFRSSFNGFNREDVVRYMEFLNTKHSAQVAQLSSELEYMRGKQNTMDANRVSELEQKLSAAEAENAILTARIAELEQKLAAQGQSAGQAEPSAAELEAYRRAERVERMAKERSAQIVAQAEGTLVDVNTKLSGASLQIGTVADQIAEQLNQLRAAMCSGMEAMQESTAAMAALHTDIQE